MSSATEVTTKESLAALCGPVIDLAPPLNVQPGTILLTLRHGKPVDIVRTGRKLRRGRGLPLTMSPQGVAISTETIPVTVGVRDVRLKGPYQLTLVTADLRIRVDERDDYRGLRAYVERKGLNFAALLDGEIANELDRRIRSGLGPRTAADLHELGNITDLCELTTPLLGGLFCVESIAYVTPTYDAEFLRARDAVARSATDAAEKLLELHEQVPLDQALSKARDQQLLEEATRRGLSMIEHENPALLEQRRQQEHEIQKTLIEQLDALRRGGGSDAVRQMLGGLGGRSDQQPATIPVTAITEEHASGSADPVDAMPELRTDPALAHLWRTAGLPGEPLGICLDAVTPNVTVLAVCEGTLDASAAASAQQVFAERVGATTVIALPDVRNLHDLVAGYLFARLPALASAMPTIDVVADADGVVVRLSSREARLSSFLGQINDPDARLLDPLTSVLPYDHLDVVVAEFER